MAGVLSNGGSGHALTHPFAVFGYHVTGSTGTLFLYGIVVGALALFGLSVLLAGARRTSRRGREARRGLTRSRRETAAVSQDRDDLLGQRETARAYTASTLGSGPAAAAAIPAEMLAASAASGTCSGPDPPPRGLLPHPYKRQTGLLPMSPPTRPPTRTSQRKGRPRQARRAARGGYGPALRPAPRPRPRPGQQPSKDALAQAFIDGTETPGRGSVRRGRRARG